jgi:TPR repeat protein
MLGGKFIRVTPSEFRDVGMRREHDADKECEKGVLQYEANEYVKAFNLFESALRYWPEHMQSLLMLSIHYYFGFGVSNKDKKKAFELMRKAIIQSQMDIKSWMKYVEKIGSDATFVLAMYYVEGKGGGENMCLGFDLLYRIAVDGHNAAQLELAKLYFEGVHLYRKDYEQSAHFARLAAIDSDEATKQKALKFLLEKCALSGQHLKIFMLETGKYYHSTEDYCKALDCFVKAAELGCEISMRIVASYCQQGKGGLSANDRQGTMIFVNALQLGIAEVLKELHLLSEGQIEVMNEPGHMPTSENLSSNSELKQVSIPRSPSEGGFFSNRSKVDYPRETQEAGSVNLRKLTTTYNRLGLL